jgi:hypothetical protein
MRTRYASALRSTIDTHVAMIDSLESAEDTTEKTIIATRELPTAGLVSGGT